MTTTTALREGPGGESAACADPGPTGEARRGATERARVRLEGLGFASDDLQRLARPDLLHLNRMLARRWSWLLGVYYGLVTWFLIAALVLLLVTRLERELSWQDGLFLVLFGAALLITALVCGAVWTQMISDRLTDPDRGIGLAGRDLLLAPTRSRLSGLRRRRRELRAIEQLRRHAARGGLDEQATHEVLDTAHGPDRLGEATRRLLLLHCTGAALEGSPENASSTRETRASDGHLVGRLLTLGPPALATVTAAILLIEALLA